MIKEMIVAPDMPTAMKLIKDRFGEEAMILGTKTRHVRKPGSIQLDEEVEVEIGLDLSTSGGRPRPENGRVGLETAMTAPQAPSLLADEIKRFEGLVDGIESQSEFLSGNAEMRLPLFRRLEAMGLWPGTLREICEEFVNSVPPASQADINVGLAEIGKRLRCVEAMEIEALRGRHALLGPPGVGKTDLALKLTRAIAAGKGRAVLIAYAPEHPGERKRLELAGERGGFETVIAPDADALRGALGYLAKSDLIVIDMPPYSPEQLDLLGSFEAEGNREPLLRHIVLAADGGWRGREKMLAGTDFLALSRCDLGEPLLPALELSSAGDYSLSFLGAARGMEAVPILAQKDELLGTLIAPESIEAANEALKADSAEAGGHV